MAYSKELHKEYVRKWWADNKEKQQKYRKTANLKRAYGITLEQFNEMLVSQSALCAICHKPETQVHPKSGLPYQLAVDHCHKINKVRQLLCSRCNRALGMVNDDVGLMQKMIDYVQKHNLGV